MHQVARRHPPQDVEVAQHAGRLGDDGHGMAESLQHLQHAAGDAQCPLDRLVGIGVGAERHRPRHVAGPAKLLFQKRRQVGLDVEQRLEVETGRVPEIGMGRPGVAIDAAMLAAAVGVDGAVEADIRRAVPGDRRAGAVPEQGGRQRREVGQVLDRAPAVVEGLPRGRLEPHRRVGQRPAPLARQRWRGLGRQAAGFLPAAAGRGAAVGRRGPAGGAGQTIRHGSVPPPFTDTLPSRPGRCQEQKSNNRSSSPWNKACPSSSRR